MAKIKITQDMLSETIQKVLREMQEGNDDVIMQVVERILPELDKSQEMLMDAVNSSSTSNEVMEALNHLSDAIELLQEYSEKNGMA